MSWKNKADKIAYNYKYTCAYTLKHKTLAYEILGNKCVCCGETEKVFLSLDHINNDGAIDRIKIKDVLFNNTKKLSLGRSVFSLCV